MKNVIACSIAAARIGARSNSTRSNSTRSNSTRSYSTRSNSTRSYSTLGKSALYESTRCVSMLFILLAWALAVSITTVRAQPVAPSSAEPGLTIYNQNFGVVRQSVHLDLQNGLNRVQVSDLTTLLEPDSVVLRDPAGRRHLQILEQNFRADPVTQEMLLFLFEGQTIDFQVQRGDETVIIPGKIIRSGYVPVSPAQRNAGLYNPNSLQPIIEIEGKLRFQLPGVPLFPSLTDQTVLKPVLHWVLQTDKPGALDAELAYITGGLTWKADYNVVAPENGDLLNITGWVTMSNQTGRNFENAKIKLMAGDVSKIQPGEENYLRMRSAARTSFAIGAAEGAVVSQRAFDEYHLYTLGRTATLRDCETKQVEFVQAAGVKSERLYVYDGMAADSRYQGYSYENYRREQSYGTQSNPKVWVMREFKNSKENGLGIPLPKGRVRFYRRDAATVSEVSPIEFTGENVIDHTPKDETVRIYTGNAFDIVGSRRQTAWKLDPQNNKWVDESFEIKLRNHKKEAVEVRVVERLYRGANWDVTTKSNAFLKTDAQNIEFRIQLKPDEEKTLTYTVHYSW